MYNDDIINKWAELQDASYFYPLGDFKIEKLSDFLSSADIFRKIAPLVYYELWPDLEIFDYASKQKLKLQKSLIKFFKGDRQEAARHYSYFKKIIDNFEKFEVFDTHLWLKVFTKEDRDDFIKAIPPRKPRKSPTKKKAVKPSNVVYLADYKRKAS